MSRPRAVVSPYYTRQDMGTGGIVSGSGKGAASPHLETPEGLRAMALHAVRLAVAIPGDAGAKRLLEARELEARAAALERDGG
jgi:hypothetical protein